ncbi:methicillin resistance protein, partial [candidate division WWE3 bacterium CG_4_10_14_0_2_um_filter_42_7]
NIAIPDTRPDFTQYLDLRNGFEPIYRSWTKGHASAVQQARREGITIREAVSIEEWKDYFVIYEDSLRRWGEKATNSYPFVLFENLFKNGCRNVKLWLACFENKPVSGALCFYNNHHVVWWHGASLENYFPKRPAHLLQYEIIKDACEKGYWWYDFNPSGGHEGVVKFKKGFGAEKIGSDVICISSFSFKLLNKIRKYLIKLIRKN